MNVNKIKYKKNMITTTTIKITIINYPKLLNILIFFVILKYKINYNF